MNFYAIYIFFTGLLCLILIRKHILLCLIRLEFVVLSLLLTTLFYCIIYSYTIYTYLIIITFYVCEGVLGLRVLVYIIRCHGNDYLIRIFLW